MVTGLKGHWSEMPVTAETTVRRPLAIAGRRTAVLAVAGTSSAAD